MVRVVLQSLPTRPPVAVAATIRRPSWLIAGTKQMAIQTTTARSASFLSTSALSPLLHPRGFLKSRLTSLRRGLTDYFLITPLLAALAALPWLSKVDSWPKNSKPMVALAPRGIRQNSRIAGSRSRLPTSTSGFECSSHSLSLSGLLLVRWWRDAFELNLIRFFKF